MYLPPFTSPAPFLLTLLITIPTASAWQLVFYSGASNCQLGIENEQYWYDGHDNNCQIIGAFGHDCQTYTYEGGGACAPDLRGQVDRSITHAIPGSNSSCTLFQDTGCKASFSVIAPAKCAAFKKGSAGSFRCS